MYSASRRHRISFNRSKMQFKDRHFQKQSSHSLRLNAMEIISQRNHLEAYVSIIGLNLDSQRRTVQCYRTPLFVRSKEYSWAYW